MKSILELMEGYIQVGEKLLENTNGDHKQEIQTDFSLLKSAYYILKSLEHSKLIQ